ncbi:hypothetical protein HRbin17_02386 [bacterium HR17]|uniref:Uncharacterized protein n=1 Tax=Candidatus Fervidibacter japonicus TaxID=2035412 RepID=A0A2H5XFB3_9BACT|nr:hypothetical protein HRbin17_02386 [bacterium HR17]
MTGLLRCQRLLSVAAAPGCGRANTAQVVATPAPAAAFTAGERQAAQTLWNLIVWLRARESPDRSPHMGCCKGGRSVPRSLVILGAALTLSVAAAQPQWTVNWQFEVVVREAQLAELQANGVPLLRWRGENAAALVQEWARRLNDARWRGATANAVTIARVEGGYALILESVPLLTVTHATARAWGSDAYALVQQWASRLRQALSWEWIAVPADSVTVAVGEEVALPLFGNASGVVQVEARPPEPVRLRVSTTNDKIAVHVHGVDVGAGVLRIVKGRVGVRLPYRILHRAAQWQRHPIAYARGRQISLLMAHEAVENAVLNALRLQLGAQWRLTPVSDGQAVRLLSPNTSFAWRLQVTGDQLLPVDETVTVPLRAFPQSLGDADLLVISNDPETFRDYRVLCRGTLPPAQTVRFMVHHRNGLPRPAWLALELLNTEEQPIEVIARFGYGVPRESELQVGHEATARFLQALTDDAAVRLTLPSQSAYRLFRFLLQPRDTASVLAELRLEAPAGVAYRVVTLPTEPPKTEVLTGSQLAEALVSVSEPPPFPKPVRTLTETHTAGGAWTFISVGRYGLQLPLKGRVLHGNYGVVYRVTLRFVNPTQRTWRAQLVVEPVGGVIRGAFVVNGRLVEVPLLRPYQERVLDEFPLAPGQTRILTVVTVPAAGSFYPIQLIARTQ